MWVGPGSEFGYELGKKFLAYFNKIPSLSSFEHEIGGIAFYNHNETVFIEPKTRFHIVSAFLCDFLASMKL